MSCPKTQQSVPGQGLNLATVPPPIDLALNQYLIFGLGFPVAPHVNVTFSPSSAVVLTGGTVIIDGDDFSDSKVVGFSLSGTTTENVTGAKNSKQLPD